MESTVDLGYRPRFATREMGGGLHATHGDTEHKIMRGMGYLGLGAGAIALAPVVVNAVAAQDGLTYAAARGAIVSCGGSMPTGWAAGINEGLAQVPLVGTALAAGGFATIATAGGLAIGGMLLGNYLDKHQKPDGLPWGKIIRWGCLITSALVAAPMILSGLTMGLAFIGQLLYFNGVDMGASLMNFARNTIGTLGTSGALTGTAMAQGSAAMMVVHALTCALPLGLSGLFLGRRKEEEAPKELPSLHLPPLPGRELDGRVMQPHRLQMAAG